VEAVKNTIHFLMSAMVVIVLSLSSSATTCIQLKKFRVRQVCGQVQTVVGDVVPNASLRVQKPGTGDVIAQAQTDRKGNFLFDSLSAGSYEIVVDVAGFHIALQDFELTYPMKSVGRCEQPILALMRVADGCSSVAKVRLKEIKR
jgi:hypothetical protein